MLVHHLADTELNFHLQEYREDNYHVEFYFKIICNKSS